ncbi:MAG: DapH/DapD/GlmU-related protein [Planctomycetota bacterium]
MPRASEIAQFLSTTLHGADLVIERVSALSRPEPRSLVFAKTFSEDVARRLDSVGELLVLAAPAFEGRLRVAHVLVSRPRLAFAKAVTRFFATAAPPSIHPTASIAPTARIGAGVTIGAFSVVGDGAEIGDGTELRHHVVVGPRCRIGARCLVKSNTVIGEEGFGFDFEEDGTPVRIPHLGAAVIGDDVEIGALNTVARGTIGDTVVGRGVKTDDHVHIAHNVSVGENAILTACTEISGSAAIGRGAWLGPNCSIMDGIRIGDEAMIGLAAVVTKPVEPGMVVAGSPARVLRKRSDLKS